MAAVNRSQVHRIVTKPWEVTGLREVVVGAAETAALERFARESLLANGLMQTVSALAAAIEAKDPYTGAIRSWWAATPRPWPGAWGWPRTRCAPPASGAFSTTVARSASPSGSSSSPAALDNAEFREMKRHPEVGFGIVAPIDDLPESPGTR